MDTGYDFRAAREGAIARAQAAGITDCSSALLGYVDQGSTSRLAPTEPAPSRLVEPGYACCVCGRDYLPDLTSQPRYCPGCASALDRRRRMVASRSLAGRLTDREGIVLRLRQREGQSQASVARALGVSPERARQIEREAIRKLEYQAIFGLPELDG